MFKGGFCFNIVYKKKIVFMINGEFNAAKCNDFSKLYPELVQHIVDNGNLVNSRNGSTLEILDFKTIIEQPENNLVGGFNRNMNIFFLFAEALWIWLGKKDVEFLEFFNSQMKEYSDDGINFHAPYGWRLRKWSEPSDNRFNVEKIYAEKDFDQIREIVKMLSENPQDRRAVMSIWNPLLDLNVKCKDLPCNDMVMLKIRDNKLYMTIANRSNDLHWGLPTNVFQFSFIGFILSEILGVKRGTQVHNSQSLHVYMNHPLTLQIVNLKNKNNSTQLYYEQYLIKQKYIFEETSLNASEKLNEIDKILENMFVFLLKKIQNKDSNFSYEECLELSVLKTKSDYLYFMFLGLFIYIQYGLGKRDRVSKEMAIGKIRTIGNKFLGTPESKMMLNFFEIRLNENNSSDYL